MMEPEPGLEASLPSTASLLEALDPAQRRVATTLRGPVVVRAGAGSGKTRAITHRIAYGVRTGAFQPNEVLAVTFTVRAAAEMQERLEQLRVTGVFPRTFHAAALRQLRYFWPRVIGSALPELVEHPHELVAAALTELGYANNAGMTRDVLSDIEWAKVNQMSPTDVVEHCETVGRRPVAAMELADMGRAYWAYEDVKYRRGLLDFTDVLLSLVGILTEHPEVAAQVQQQYRIFTVDEYQDVNPLQQRLLSLWLGDRDDLCVVGDANQTIYSFTGARSHYLRDFTRKYPHATVIELDRTYRCTPQIAACATAVLAAAPEVEQQADVISLSSVREDGPAPEILTWDDDEAEISGVLDRVEQLIAEGISPGEIAILSRRHAQLSTLAQACRDRKIAHLVRRGPQTGEHPDAVPPRLQRDSITLASLHAAKGLEWDAVFLTGLAEGLLPISYATRILDIAEERRLMYVGMTRARTLLYLSWAYTQAGAGTPPRARSRFLQPLADAAGRIRPALLTGFTRPDQIVADAAAMELDPQAKAARAARQRVTRGLRKCRHCGKSLVQTREVVLGRCETCPAPENAELELALYQWRDQWRRQSGATGVIFITDLTLQAIAERVVAAGESLEAVPGVQPELLGESYPELQALLAQYLADVD